MKLIAEADVNQTATETKVWKNAKELREDAANNDDILLICEDIQRVGGICKRHMSGVIPTP